MILAAITTYKRRPEMVERAIKSVIAQTITDWNLVVVDDSPADYELRDEVRKMVEGWTKKDNRIFYTAHEKNMGVSVARNTALRFAETMHRGGGYDFLAYLDDDDEWLPVKLEKHLQKFSECGEDTAMVVGGRTIVLLDDNDNVLYQYDAIPQKTDDKGNILERGLQGGPTGAPLIRTRCFKEIGGFDEKLFFREDWEIWIRIAQKYKIAFVREPLYMYYMHKGEHKVDGVLNQIQGQETIIKKYMSYLQEDKNEYWHQLQEVASLYVKEGKTKKAFSLWWAAVKLKPFRVFRKLGIIQDVNCKVQGNDKRRKS